MATARVGPEARPNIRIEIHNDIAEQPMEVDGADVEPEDGEIPDNDLETSLESYNSSVINTNRVSRPASIAFICFYLSHPLGVSNNTCLNMVGL